MTDIFFSFEGAFFGFTADKNNVPIGCTLTGKAYARRARREGDVTGLIATYFLVVL